MKSHLSAANSFMFMQTINFGAGTAAAVGLSQRFSSPLKISILPILCRQAPLPGRDDADGMSPFHQNRLFVMRDNRQILAPQRLRRVNQPVDLAFARRTGERRES